MEPIVLEKSLLTLTWRVLAVRAVVGIIFGVAAMAWPVETGVALVFLWGFWALFDGVASGVAVFTKGVPTAGRVLFALVAVVSLAAAVFALAQPIDAAKTLIWILGIWLVVRGLIELAEAAFSHRAQSRILVALGGILSIVLGALFIANPGQSAVSIAWLVGLIAFVWGLVFLVGALVLRKQVNKLGDNFAAGHEVVAGDVVDAS